MSKELKPGDDIRIMGDHPHNGAYGKLISFGAYGLSFLGLKGWRISLRAGGECYAKEVNLKQLKRKGEK